MKELDLSTLELLTPLHSPGYGKGFLVKIDNRNPCYQYTVMFMKAVLRGKPFIRYNKYGKEGPFSFYPTLFLEEQVIPKEAYQEPMPHIPIDTLIEVEEAGKRVLRYFKEWHNTNPICFSDGATSITGCRSQTYYNWRIHEDK